MELLRELRQGDGLVVGRIEAAAHGCHEMMLLGRQYDTAARQFHGQEQQGTEQVVDALFGMAALALRAAVHEFEQMAEIREDLFCLQDGQHVWRQEFSRGQVRQLQVTDGTGVDG